MSAMLKTERHAPRTAVLALAAAVPLADGRAARKPAPSAARGTRPFAAAVKLVLPPLVGIALVVLVWQFIAARNTAFPTPWATLQEALVLFADPFYRNSPNDQASAGTCWRRCSGWRSASGWPPWWAFHSAS